MSLRAERLENLTIAALAIFTFTLYIVSLGSAPVYLNEVEVTFALHARAIATTAHDTNGRFMPLYFQMPPIGEDVWFHPAVVYFSAPFLKVLPLSEWTVRLPSVVIAVIDVALMYLLAKRLFGRPRPALLAALLLALTPAHFIHGRLAMDYLYPVPFVLGWLLCLSIFLERRQEGMLFAATSLLGLGMYTYIASLIMMPVYLGATALAIGRQSGNRRRFVLIAAAGFAWPLVFLSWLVFHPAMVRETLGRYQIGQVATSVRAQAALSMPQLLDQVRRAVRFSELTGRISLYWYFFDPAYLFVTGGYAAVDNSTRHVGVFLLPLIVFVPVGLVVLIRRPTPMHVTLLVGFLGAPLAACLVVPEPYAIDRELALVPFGVLLATFGVEAMLAARQRHWRMTALGLLALVPILFAFFLFDYYGDYRIRSAIWFNSNRRGAFEEIFARDSRQPVPAVYLSTNHITYLDAYWRLYLAKHHREDLLARTVYFDADTVDLQKVPRGALLLASSSDKRLQASTNARELVRLMDVLEPGDPPQFSILRR